FQGDEFAWADSAYAVNSRTIPVHKEPASFDPNNARFDTTLSRIRVRSEHCMGALKGRFQCLRGLRIRIKSAEDHLYAIRWVVICIILHNLIIDIEGTAESEHLDGHGLREEEADGGGDAENREPIGTGDGAKRRQLVAELQAYYEQ
ncbi:hypothetical protein BDZ89DRAFT_908235, partial [Hymenopellis radicata]